MESELIKRLNRELGTDKFSFRIVRKQIKHVYFRVYADKNEVVVSAPAGLENITLENIIASKKNWIRRQIKKTLQKSSTAQAMPLLSAEGIFFEGRYYPIIKAPSMTNAAGLRVDRENTVIYMACPPGLNSGVKLQKKLEAWLRDELKTHLSNLVTKWEPVMGVRVREFRIRKMKTRWGSCNIRDRRIWLNFALIHYRPRHIEYVAVHEMAHLLERKHSKRFNGLMDRFVPDWKILKAELNNSPSL